MLVLFLCGLDAIVLGAQAGHIEWISLGSGALCFGWIGMLKERGTDSGLLRWLRYGEGFWWRYQMARTDTARIIHSPVWEIFLTRYPMYIRCPFVLTDDGEIHLATSASALRGPWKSDELPLPIRNLTTLLSEQQGAPTDPRVVLLLANRAIRSRERERLRVDVIQPCATRWTEIWMQYATWEEEHMTEFGRLSLLHRELLAQYLLDTFEPVAVRSLARASRHKPITRAVDDAIARAKRVREEARRAQRLQVELLAQDHAVLKGRQEVPRTVATTTHMLAIRADENLRAVTEWLYGVFVTESDRSPDHLAKSEHGSFATCTGGEKIVFQVGWLVDGNVSQDAVDRAYAMAAREGAKRAMVLNLGPMLPDVVQAADRLGVLILPVQSLERLLAYHNDRMWEAVEWSLRTTMAPGQDTMEEDLRDLSQFPEKGLELGLLT